MSESISSGPVSSLPGSSHRLDENDMCDHHEDRKAVRRIQGETDSFGCEYLYMCQECWDEYREEMAKPVLQNCEWCGNETTDCVPHRDYEEGMAGRVYQVCSDCRRREREELLADDDDYYY